MLDHTHWAHNDIHTINIQGLFKHLNTKGSETWRHIVIVRLSNHCLSQQLMAPSLSLSLSLLRIHWFCYIL